MQNYCNLKSNTAQICKEHQQDFDSNRGEFIEKCNIGGLFNGTLNKEEIYHCYKPQCNLHSDSYLIKQCRLPEGWCWCSSLDGHPIPGTFQSNVPPDYCSKFHHVEQMTASCTMKGLYFSQPQLLCDWTFLCCLPVQMLQFYSCLYISLSIQWVCCLPSEQASLLQSLTQCKCSTPT